jgi:tetratricopeptide (TPR) repeat protein
LLRQAQEDALESATIEELTAVAKLCRKGLAASSDEEMAATLGRLAAWAYNRRGEMLTVENRHDEAFEDFQAAISLDPTCSLAIHNRAVTLGQRNQFAAALRDFDRVIELNPGLAIAYRNRAELLAAIGRMEAAIADYGQAIASLPDDAVLYRSRAYALQRLGDFDAALDDLNRSIKLDASDADTFTQRGNLAAERGDFAQAVKDFHRALAIDPNWAEAHRSLAWLRATCEDSAFRDPAEALAEAEIAARLSPNDDYLVLDTLAAAHAIAKRYGEAAEIQRQALAAAPADQAEPLQHRLRQYERGVSQPANPRIEPMVRQATLETPLDER